MWFLLLLPSGFKKCFKLNRKRVSQILAIRHGKAKFTTEKFSHLFLRALGKFRDEILKFRQQLNQNYPDLLVWFTNQHNIFLQNSNFAFDRSSAFELFKNGVFNFEATVNANFPQITSLPKSIYVHFSKTDIQGCKRHHWPVCQKLYLKFTF